MLRVLFYIALAVAALVALSSLAPVAERKTAERSASAAAAKAAADAKAAASEREACLGKRAALLAEYTALVKQKDPWAAARRLAACAESLQATQAVTCTSRTACWSPSRTEKKYNFWLLTKHN